MVKRLLLLSIPILLTAGMLGVFWLFFGIHQPPAWQPQLDKYISYKGQELSAPITVQAVDHATKPWDLIRDKSFIVYGDSAYYRTDVNYEQPQAGGIPLPDPPVEVYCILLNIQGSRAPGVSSNLLVFAALHRDIYNADWVIQEVEQAPSSPEVMQTISRVGCNAAHLQIAAP